MFAKNSGGSLAMRSSSGSISPRSANSATQSTWIMSTSGSFFAWCCTIARSWKPVKGESTDTSLISGWSFSKAALNLGHELLADLGALPLAPTHFLLLRGGGKRKTERRRQRHCAKREHRGSAVEGHWRLLSRFALTGIRMPVHGRGARSLSRQPP